MTAQYFITVDSTDDQTYASDISADVLKLAWRLGMAKPYDLIAAQSILDITLYNANRDYSPEHASSPLQIGRRVRLQIKPDVLSPAVTHFVGFIRSIQPTTGELGERLTKVRVTGAEEEYAQTHVLIPLQVDVSADEVLALVFETTPLIRIPTDFDTGVSVLSYVGDLWGDGITAERAIREMVEAERGWFFYSREGVATFRNRHALLSDTMLDAAFEDELVAMDYDFGAGMVNDVRVRMRPRKVGAEDSVLWTLSRPQLIRFAVQRQITARLYDNSGQRIGALEVISPEPYVDYTANTERDGTGIDRTMELQVEVAEISGGAVKLTLTNLSLDNLYLLAGARIRGTPVYPGDSVLVEREDEDAQLTYGIRTLSLSLPALDSIEEADGLARYELLRRVIPRGEIRSITLDEHNRFEDALRLTFFDRIRVIEAQTEHDSEYFIVAETHEVSEGGYKHRVTWTLEPVSPVDYWALDVEGVMRLGY